MRRQRCLLSALAAQTSTADLLRAFPRLVPVLKRSVTTDIPIGRLPALLGAASGRRARTTTIGFTPPGYVTGYAGGYPIPDVAKIRATVRKLLFHRPAATATTRPPAAPTRTTATTRPPQGPDDCGQGAQPPA
jgi:hypothetical protein